jgi:16S rRNA (adenine1518-N6/adenine1519-N6)-dimethyltransferase
MAIYKPSELRQFLEKLGLSPKKGLSQNFLIDGNIIRKIIETAQVQANELVLEIGPGPGALTEAVLNQGATVIAVEKDSTLATALERLQELPGKLLVYNEDIMEFSLEEKLGPLVASKGKAKLIANLPYHLSSPILASLVQRRDLFSHLIVIVQDEMARRFVAKPNSKDFSSFSLFLQFFSRPHYAFKVRSSSFFPVPKVESAVVNFELQEPPYVSDQEAFLKCIRTAFGQRRKMLRSTLKELYPHIEQALDKLGLDSRLRPENLSLENWISLFERMKD